MSTLYGIISHAALSKLLRRHQHKSFCECCADVVGNDDDDAVIAVDDKQKNNLNSGLNKNLVEFLREHHLSVFAVEKHLRVDNLGGRVDCIFLENRHRKTLYIVDWKFFRHIPSTLPMEYVIQLNLYMYMMKRLNEFSNFNFKLYCVIFSALDSNKLKVFKTMILPDDFLKTLTSIMSFHSWTHT